MSIVPPSTATGKALFEGTQSFRSHDNLTDNKDAGGAYDHVNTEFAATECEEFCDWFRYINALLKSGIVAISVYNSDSVITTATAVYVSDYDDTEGKFIVEASAINDPAKIPQFYLLDAIAAGASGVAYRSGTLEDQDTSLGAVGDAVYAAASGGWSLSAPAAGNIAYIIGRISVSDSTVGTIELFPPIKLNIRLSEIDVAGGTDIGGALGGTDEFIMDRSGTKYKSDVSRIPTYVQSVVKLDDLQAPEDNTDLNASTTAHGLVPKAVAPAAGILNVVGIANGETALSNKTIFDNTNPAALGVASPGTQVVASRRDHVHTVPVGDDIEVAYSPVNYDPLPSGSTDLEAHLAGIDQILGDLLGS